MIIRRSAERGFFDHDWLRTYHSFSFSEYYDPEFMGFRALRVINEDRVQRGMGFGTHPHRDMEIISYVLDGELAHKDSMGNVQIIRPGEVQRMSAGTGVVHSEYNNSDKPWTHFLQIWILPDRQGLAPSYEQKAFPAAERQGRWRLLASPDGRDGSVSVHQDVNLYGGLFEPGQSARYEIPAGRYVWLQIARGAVEVNGERLEAGDGAAFVDGGAIALAGLESAEALLFDLAWGRVPPR